MRVLGRDLEEMVTRDMSNGILERIGGLRLVPGLVWIVRDTALELATASRLHTAKLTLRRWVIGGNEPQLSFHGQSEFLDVCIGVNGEC